MKILVTGGSGFIGSYLIDELLKEGYSVVNVDLFPPDTHEDKWRLIDITSPVSGLFHLFKKHNFDVVYHLAAQTSVPKSVQYPDIDARMNIFGTLNIIEMCKKFNSKLVFASTAATYGNPVELPITESHVQDPQSPYGISKLACEAYIRTSGVSHTILRFANVYGNGGGGVIDIFIDRVMKNQPLIVFGTGEQTRDFIYVKDLVSALIKCIDKGNGYTFNISTQEMRTLNDMIDVLRIYMGGDFSFPHVEYADKREGDIEDSYMTNHLAKEVLGWTPKFPLELGINDMLMDITGMV